MLKHKLSVTLAAVFALVLLGGAGCGSRTSQTTTNVARPELPDTFVTYAAEAGWSIAHPKDWRVEKQDELVFFYAPTLDNGISPNVNVIHQQLPARVSVEDMQEEVEKGLADAGGTVVESKLVDLPAGRAIWIDYTVEAEGFVLYGTQIGMMNDRYYDVITFTGDKESSEMYQDELDLMAKSFTPAS